MLRFTPPGELPAVKHNRRKILGENGDAVSLPQSNWLNQRRINLINRAIGLVAKLNGKIFLKGTAIALSYFLVVFPPFAWIYYFFIFHTVMFSVPLLVMFLSGFLSIRAARRMEIT